MCSHQNNRNNLEITGKRGQGAMRTAVLMDNEERTQSENKIQIPVLIFGHVLSSSC